MNKLRVLVSVIGITIIVGWSLKSYNQEVLEEELLTKKESYNVQIIKLRCGKKGNIKFRFKGEVISRRIYLDDNECKYLQDKSTIGIKTDLEGTFVFAKKSYNDWKKAEKYSIFAIAFFLIILIFKYQLFPELKKIHTKSQRKIMQKH